MKQYIRQDGQGFCLSDKVGWEKNQTLHAVKFGTLYVFISAITFKLFQG